MSQTKIISCDCDHPYQDKKYGKGRRVGNRLKPQKGLKDRHRCTVCRKVQD